jgi:uncharacterized protein DUF4432
MNLAGAVDLGLRPDRGLDLAAASYAGRAFAWTTPLGEVPGTFGDWSASWGGGLMTTCGLDNVGVPSEGLPQHGTYTYLAAHDVVVDGGQARGIVEDPRGLRVERRLANDPAAGRIELVDAATNTSTATLEAPLLYHCNLLWGEPAIDSQQVVPRDDHAAAHDWRVLGDGPERVYEHVFLENQRATVASVSTQGLRVTIRSSLPRLWQWVDPSRGVIGIEPANCSVLGRAHDRAAGRLPLLSPGETRVTTLTIEVEEL